MKADGKKRKQVLLRLPEELVDLLKERAEGEGLSLARFCERYLQLVRFLEVHQTTGQIVACQTKRRLLLLMASDYDQMYGAKATYREGRRMGLEVEPLLSQYSVEDTLSLFTTYGWGIFDFQPEVGRVTLFNPPTSSAEFVRGLVEGLTGLTLRTLTTDRDVFVYEIVV
ncbi:MAG TPA: hypothetical protein VMV49_16395 [Candidatus Deferrimicrobium sp.]|nr:hypothetical protein [Candidatus Deferrimicrobium sp.]